MSDQEIIKGLQARQGKLYEQAAAYIKDTYGPKVLGYVQQPPYSGSQEDGEDIFQKAFLEALLNIWAGKYEDQSKFGGFFMTIARRRWIDEYNKRKRNNNNLPIEDTADYDTLLQQIIESETTAITIPVLFLYNDLWTKIYKVWKSWDDTPCKDLLYRSYGNDACSIKELAAFEGIPEGTMRKRIFDCCQKFKKALTKADVDYLKIDKTEKGKKKRKKE